MSQWALHWGLPHPGDQEQEIITGQLHMVSINLGICIPESWKCSLVESASTVIINDYVVCLAEPGGWEFSSATTSVSPGYFHSKQKENRAKSTSWLYSSPSTNRFSPASWNVSDSPVKISLRFLVRFVAFEFSVFVCVCHNQFSIPGKTRYRDEARQRREKNDLLSFVDPPSSLPSLISSPLSLRKAWYSGYFDWWASRIRPRSLFTLITWFSCSFLRTSLTRTSGTSWLSLVPI